MTDRNGAQGASTPVGRWWRSFAARSTILVGLLLAALAAILTATTALDARRAAVARVESAAAADGARIAAWLARGEPLAAVLADLSADPAILYAYAESVSGRPILGREPAAPPPLVDAASLARSAEAHDLIVLTSAGDVAHAAKSVALPRGDQATIRFGRSLASAAEEAAQATARGLLAALAFLTLALPSVALAADRAAAPLRALARALTRAGPVPTEVAEAGARGDEIGALARAHLAMVRDLAQGAEALRRRALDDPLTGLPNRAGLARSMASAIAAHDSVTVLRVELDGLARVAEGLGPEKGDQAAIIAADRLRSAAHEWIARSAGPAAPGRPLSVTIARLSDYEFALLVEGVTVGAADDLARRAFAAFETPLALDEHRIMLTLAVGAARSPEDGLDPDALLRGAAAALGAARAVGPRTIRFAAAELSRRAVGRIRLEQDLRRAIACGELEVHYQPQLSLRSGALVGAEALVRWRHPIRGLIAPGEFVPVAEESGLVEPLGRFVLETASRRTAEWAALGMEVRIAVNVSALQLRDSRFAETTLAAIRDAGAHPALIELEITESAAMLDAAHAARELKRLKEAGVRIAIDDFGTGFSNLSALTRMPFDVLKIDRSFVQDALSVAGARVVVETVIGMAASLGVATVAEGIETEEQRAFVAARGCDLGQGYLFAKPMPAPAFEAWQRRRLVASLREISRSAESAGSAPGVRAAG